MLNKNFRKDALALALGLAVASAAHATITFDGMTGKGFVGKGDVQYTFGWNNADFQDNAESVAFQAVSEVVTEVSWECTNSKNENVQQRERTTTTTVVGLVDSIARDKKKQITGFTLQEYDGSPTESSETDGPSLNSCPTNWILTTSAGDPQFVSSYSSLEVSDDSGSTWTELLEKPTL